MNTQLIFWVLALIIGVIVVFAGFSNLRRAFRYENIWAFIWLGIGVLVSVFVFFTLELLQVSLFGYISGPFAWIFFACRFGLASIPFFMGCVNIPEGSYGVQVDIWGQIKENTIPYTGCVTWAFRKPYLVPAEDWTVEIADNGKPATVYFSALDRAVLMNEETSALTEQRDAIQKKLDDGRRDRATSLGPYMAADAVLKAANAAKQTAELEESLAKVALDAAEKNELGAILALQGKNPSVALQNNFAAATHATAAARNVHITAMQDLKRKQLELHRAEQAAVSAAEKYLTTEQEAAYISQIADLNRRMNLLGVDRSSDLTEGTVSGFAITFRVSRRFARFYFKAKDRATIEAEVRRIALSALNSWSIDILINVAAREVRTSGTIGFLILQQLHNELHRRWGLNFLEDDGLARVNVDVDFYPGAMLRIADIKLPEWLENAMKARAVARYGGKAKIIEARSVSDRVIEYIKFIDEQVAHGVSREEAERAYKSEREYELWQEANKQVGGWPTMIRQIFQGAGFSPTPPSPPPSTSGGEGKK